MANENVQHIVQMRDTKANCAAFTGTLEEGMVAYATDTAEFGIYTGGAWKWLGPSTMPFAPTAQGDMIAANATPAWARLALTVPGAGICNYLGVNNGEVTPTWKSASSNPGAAAAILATNTSGQLTLFRLFLNLCSDTCIMFYSNVFGAVSASEVTWVQPSALFSVTIAGAKILAKGVAAAGIGLDVNAATGNFNLYLSPSNLSANRRVTFPDADGTAALLEAANVFTTYNTFGGATNATQLIVKANVAQTNAQPLVRFVKSDGVTNLLYLHSDDETNFYSGYLAGSSNTVTGVGNEGKFNLFIGYRAGRLNSTGNVNVFIGPFAGDKNTSGTDNFYMGNSAGVSCTQGIHNVAIGSNCFSLNQTGSYNMAIGANTLAHQVDVHGNVAIGYQAGHSTLAGSGVYIGYSAGVFETGGTCLYIDNTTRAGEADGKIKALLYGMFNASMPSQFLTVNGVTKCQMYSADTNAVRAIAEIHDNSTGTPAAGFGGALDWYLHSSTTVDQLAGRIAVSWVDATHATRKAKVGISAYDTAVRLGFEVAADGVGVTTKTFGGQLCKVTDVNDTYTVLASDYMLSCSKATAFTVTLPTAVVGQTYVFKNYGAGNVTITAPGVDTFDEVDSDIILTQYDSVTLICRAANAWVKV